MIRGLKGEFIDPLTGEVDWLFIPQAAGASLPAHNLTPGVNGTGGVPPALPTGGGNSVGNGNAGNTGNTDSSGTPGPNGTTNPNAPPGLPGIPIKDYAGGPFIGVRPNAHGKSMMTLFGADTYETWVYTTLDYNNEKNLRLQAAATVYH